ncbi:hypothetical protein [Nonomuraea soli]|uniref:Uncharacterized protein n=1 Tax=Nonomuraea soli TaxID=1032476 RepID=A0A7W0CNN4_9ACTN|nr:hypothetical protein [Nonomuraea soli]MBA2894492.1 hypothetical protein [Nonomuraea soli]
MERDDRTLDPATTGDVLSPRRGAEGADTADQEAATLDDPPGGHLTDPGPAAVHPSGPGVSALPGGQPTGLGAAPSEGPRAAPAAGPRDVPPAGLGAVSTGAYHLPEGGEVPVAPGGQDRPPTAEESDVAFWSSDISPRHLPLEQGYDLTEPVEPVLVPPPPDPEQEVRRRTRILVAAAVAVVLVGGSAGWLLSSAGPEESCAGGRCVTVERLDGPPSATVEIPAGRTSPAAVPSQAPSRTKPTEAASAPRTTRPQTVRPTREPQASDTQPEADETGDGAKEQVSTYDKVESTPEPAAQQEPEQSTTPEASPPTPEEQKQPDKKDCNLLEALFGCP